MTTLTAPAPQVNTVSNNGEKPINLFQLGCLLVIRASYWSCRIGNEPQDFHLSAIDRRDAYPTQFARRD